MAEEAEATELSWLGRPGVLKRVIFVGGGSMALISLGVCVFVDVLGWFFRNSVGGLAVAAAFVSVLALSSARYLFDRLRSRSGLPPAGYGRITYTKMFFLLIQLGATAWLAVISLITWAVGPDANIPAFQALILVLVGGVFISMTLSAIAHLVEMMGSAAGLRPRASRPGRGGP